MIKLIKSELNDNYFDKRHFLSQLSGLSIRQNKIKLQYTENKFNVILNIKRTPVCLYRTYWQCINKNILNSIISQCPDFTL